MKSMTTKEIADVCGVDTRTVRRWVLQDSDKMSGGAGQNVRRVSHLKKKMYEAGEKGISPVFTLEETIAIIRAGGRNTLADLLAQNAAEKAGKTIGSVIVDVSVKLPPAEQMEVLYRAAIKGLISKYQFQKAIGLLPDSKTLNYKALPSPDESPFESIPDTYFPMTAHGAEKMTGICRNTIIRHAKKVGVNGPPNAENNFSKEDLALIWMSMHDTGVSQKYLSS